ncbi:MAG TPA: HAMP domain-containing sensor histidine kinase [Mycobacteriales bacterium]|nr:HAMP domain-containing sensor histidine kinase [Mycobacteriales bacterium]
MTADESAVLRRRLARERAARQEAEGIAERVTGDLYRSSDALRQANVELQSLNEALKEFVAIAAHDLRGPLTGVLGMASLLLRRGDDISLDQRVECLEAIDRQAHLLDRLISDLLTVSKIEAGAMDAAPEVVSLDAAVVVVIRDVLGPGADVDVHTAGLDAFVDPEHLRRILGNYLGNARTYGDPPVEIEARPSGSWVEIVVRDCGAGVPVDLMPRLFGKFARGDLSRQKGGTGLGLSIVQGLARVNGGDAWYEPNSPHGSCFGLRLPRAAA